MIESLVYKYLVQDTVLATALKATAETSKIYPNTTQSVGKVPCIIYTASGLSPDGSDLVSFIETVNFEWYAPDTKSSNSIEKRLTELMNIFDKFVLNSNDKEFMIRTCYLTSGGISNNYPLENKNAVNKGMSFEIKFTKEILT